MIFCLSVISWGDGCLVGAADAGRDFMDAIPAIVDQVTMEFAKNPRRHGGGDDDDDNNNCAPLCSSLFPRCAVRVNLKDWLLLRVAGLVHECTCWRQ